MKFVIYILLLFVQNGINNIVAQHIPEEVRIKQYVNANYKGAEPRMSGLYVIKTKESHGKPAVPGKNVRVHYEGCFLNNNVFDSSYKRNKPITFRLGSGRVIAGWEEGLSILKEGETAVFIIPSYLACGDRQVGPVPPDTPLVFKIELLKVDE